MTAGPQDSPVITRPIAAANMMPCTGRGVEHGAFDFGPMGGHSVTFS